MDGKPLLGMDSRRVLFLNICVILEWRIILLVLFSNIWWILVILEWNVLFSNIWEIFYFLEKYC